MPSNDEENGPRLSVDETAEFRRLLAKLLSPTAIGPDCGMPDINRMAFAERLYKSRRMRSKYFPEELFADPAWDILLLLYSLEQSGQRLSVSAACMSAGVPDSTGHRWADRLIKEGLACREKHPSDRRVSWLRLTDGSRARLDAYFDDMVGTYFRD